MQNASGTLEYSLYLHLYSENLGGVNGHGREKGSYGNGGEHDDRNRR